MSVESSTSHVKKGPLGQKSYVHFNDLKTCMQRAGGKHRISPGLAQKKGGGEGGRAGGGTSGNEIGKKKKKEKGKRVLSRRSATRTQDATPFARAEPVHHSVSHP